MAVLFSKKLFFRNHQWFLNSRVGLIENRSYLSYLIFRSWCPDRTLSQARKYIAESLGSSYAEGVILDLEKTWEESDERTPLICFLSMGSDPTNSIESLSKRHKLGKRLLKILLKWNDWNILQQFIFIIDSRISCNINGSRSRGSCSKIT